MGETLRLTKGTNKNCIHTIMELMLNSLMRCERDEFLNSRFQPDNNKANGYRDFSVFGDGHVLELKIPRDRLSQFTPLILAIYRSQ